MGVLLNTTAANATTPTFAAQRTFAVGTAQAGVGVADLNGDGKPDIAVANYGVSGVMRPRGEVDTVSVLVSTTAQNATTASFSGQQTFNVGDNPPAGLVLAPVGTDTLPSIIVTSDPGDGTVKSRSLCWRTRPRRRSTP